MEFLNEHIQPSVTLVKESLENFYNYIAQKVPTRDILLPLSSLVVVYYVILRKKEGKNRFIRNRKPCRPDEPYTGYEEPPITTQLPILDNWLMITIARKVYASMFGDYLLHRAKSQAKLDLPNGCLPEVDTFEPIVRPDDTLCNLTEVSDADIWRLIQERDKDKNTEFHFISLSDLINSYRKDKLTPLEVAQSVLSALKKTNPQLKSIIKYDEIQVLKEAKESTDRWKAGKPLSVFDGIPVAIKDEFIVGGFACRNGLPLDEYGIEYTRDDEKGLVKKLRTGGAVMIGISNMHQVGIGTFGINQSCYHGTSRNPYNTNYSTSGSSGGSASSIAAGFCPVALGSDGGGSIRLPAATCGVVGLKATYGRYSLGGLHQNCSTVGHAGPLCDNVRDTAISYAFLAGTDNEDYRTLGQPPVYLGDFENTDLKGIRIGVDYNWLNKTDPEMKAGLQKAIDWLVSNHNATVVSIHFPEKEEMARALAKTISCEMASKNDYLYETYYDDLNIDVISSLKVGRSVTGNEYLLCAKQRTRSMNALKYLFTQVDVIITPAFEAFQPVVTPSREKYGYVNLNHTLAICRFAVLGNLTGIPAMSLPVGYSKENLPVSVQLMCSWWKEDLLLRVGYAIESNHVTRRPEIHADITK